MHDVLIVADDLTGAMDTGHGFAARGYETDVELSPEEGTAGSSSPGRRNLDGPEDYDDNDSGDHNGNYPGDPTAIAIDTESREAAPERAAAAVGSAVETNSTGLVYKKVDSTLRGNVVAEVDAAMDADDAKLAVVAPAFPATGRTTLNGIHQVDGTPLSEAGYGVSESHLPTFFSRSRFPVVHLEADLVASGVKSIQDRLTAEIEAAEGPVLATCDVTREDDLAAITKGARKTAVRTLYVGSGGLAAHVGDTNDRTSHIRGRTDHPAEDRSTEENRSVEGKPIRERSGRLRGSDGSRTGVLGVVGSINPTTLEQLAAIPDDQVVRLDPADAVRDPFRAGGNAGPELIERLDHEGTAIVTGAVDESDIEIATSVAAALGEDRSTDTSAPGDVDPGDRIATALGAAASAVHAEQPPNALVVSGGDIALAVCRALSAQRIGLTGGSVADGIPIGWIADGPAAGTRIATKAGGFGNPNALVSSLDTLGQ